MELRPRVFLFCLIVSPAAVASPIGTSQAADVGAVAVAYMTCIDLQQRLSRHS